ncbi:MAG: threonylcarbamoyl-AMP synthase [Lentisphaerae bacterium]|nr:threonylcarbamoyl-AMP synthase [Lentisphaerota bacterium]
MMTSARIEAAAAALRGGLLVVAPTDTVYGVCAHYDSSAAVERLFTVKGRPDHKPIPLLLADTAALLRLGVTLSPPEQRLAAAFWPGPLTLIVQTPTGSEGVRVPDHEGMRELLRAVGGVMRVTSANLSGEAPALTAAEARRAFGDRVAMVLDGGPAAGGVPSSVVQIVGQQLTVLREGALSTALLRETAQL